MKTSGFSAAIGGALRATALMLGLLVAGLTANPTAWAQGGQVQVLRGTPGLSPAALAPARQQAQARFQIISGLRGVQVLDTVENKVGQCFRVHTLRRLHEIRCRWSPLR